MDGLFTCGAGQSRSRVLDPINIYFSEIPRTIQKTDLPLPPKTQHPAPPPPSSSAAMYPQSEMDTAFNIQVLTSVNFPDWMAKKPRRGSPRTRKTPGKSSKAPVHNINRNWTDKFQRTQRPHVPAPAKVKLEKPDTSSAAEIRKPIQYDSWELIIDGEFLLRGTLRKNLVPFFFFFFDVFHNLQIFYRLFYANLSFRLRLRLLRNGLV